MKKSLAPLAALGALVVFAAAGPLESGVDRPGGEYAFLPTADAAACAAACAQDQMCLSWSFQVHEFVGCYLKAVVPTRESDLDSVSGVSERAKSFLALTRPASGPKPAPPAPAPPVIAPAPREYEPAAVAPRAYAAASASALGGREEDLLGGP